MQEVGIVTALRGDIALVNVKRQQGSCDGCPGGTLCTSTGGDEALIEAINEAGAKEGDRVRVHFRSMSYLKGILLVYALPVLMLIVGAVIGREFISPLLPSHNPEGISAFTGFGFFAITFIGLRIVSKRIQNKGRYTPVIVEIVQ